MLLSAAGSGSAVGQGQLEVRECRRARSAFRGEGVPPGRVSFQRSGSAVGLGQLSEVRECCWADTCAIDLEIFVVKIFLWFV